MRLLHVSALVALFLSITWYRRGEIFKTFILKQPPLPHGYVADGDYNLECTTLRQYAEGPVAEKLGFCEDATFWEHYDTEGRVVDRPVILSCDTGRLKWNTVMGPLHNPEPRGSLWLYVPDKPNTGGQKALGGITRNRAHLISLVNYPPRHDLHPLGIAIWPSHGGNSSNLYVVNHARRRTVIEQFILSPDKPTEAVYIQTITSPHFISPNALALTSPNSFYVTNDHLITRRLPVLGHFLPALEAMLALPLGFILHVTVNDPPSSTSPITSLAFSKLFISFPNGIAISPSGDEIAVASSARAVVEFFKRDKDTNALSHKQTVSVPFLSDNVHYEPRHEGEARLIVAGHPNLRDLEDVAVNLTGAVAASWVVAVVPKAEGKRIPQEMFDLEAPISASKRVRQDGADWTLKTLFQSAGDERNGGFQTSATALVDPDSGALYVTGLYAREGVVMCKPGSRKSKVTSD